MTLNLRAKPITVKGSRVIIVQLYKMVCFSMGMEEAHTRELTAQPMITSATLQAGADGDVFNRNHYTSFSYNYRMWSDL